MGGTQPTPDQSTFDGSMNDLTAKIRSAHPGAYDDLNDADLTKKVLAKYPQYSDLAAPPITSGKPDLGGMIQKDETTARVAGLPGGSPITAPATDTMAKLAGAGIGAGAIAAAPAISTLAARPVAKFALNQMKEHPLATMAALGAAKHIPVAGKYIEGIPDWLPLLLGEPAAEGAAAEGEAAASNLPATKEPIDLSKAGGPLKASDFALKHEPEAAIPTGAPTGLAIDTSKAKVGELLNESLGGRPLAPGIPLREQMTGKIPAGHTAVESSAIKSYKYDPGTREFEFVSPSGAHYVHGDVSPEQIADFEKASSKGKAFNAIKKNSTYIGKFINGKRVAVKPSGGFSSASPD